MRTPGRHVSAWGRGAQQCEWGAQVLEQVNFVIEGIAHMCSCFLLFFRGFTSVKTHKRCFFWMHFNQNTQQIYMRFGGYLTIFEILSPPSLSTWMDVQNCTSWNMNNMVPQLKINKNVRNVVKKLHQLSARKFRVFFIIVYLGGFF